MQDISAASEWSLYHQEREGDCEFAKHSNAGNGDEIVYGARNFADSISVDGLHAPLWLHESDVAAHDSLEIWHPADSPDRAADGDEAPENTENDGINDASGASTPINGTLRRDGIDAETPNLVTDSTGVARSPRLTEASVSREFSGGEKAAEEYASEAVSSNKRHFSKMSNQSLKSSMRGNFLEGDSDSQLNASPVKSVLARVLYSNALETIIATAVFTNLFFICLDTDARADQPDIPGKEPAVWITLGNFLLWLIFVFEFLLRVVVERCAIFSNPENVLDVTIIAAGAIETIFFVIGMETSAVGMVRVLRLCRLLRLMRVLKLFKVLKELNRLIQMMGSCFRTLFWSTLLLVLVMTVWACITVELINPLIQELSDEHGYWADCHRCQKSYSTVFDANLTLFQTIIAGDSWGSMAVPVISHHPWSAIVLCGSLMTLVFGTLNLIVAVIVDTFAEKRARDVVTMAQDLDSAEREEKGELGRIFEKIDDNRDGSLTFDEIQEGARKVAEFRHWLRVLDIDAGDLHNLFVLLDEDGSGEIDPQEFIDAMHRIKNSESKTATRFVKHIVTGVARTQSTMADTVDFLENKMNEVTGSLSKVMELHDHQMEMQQHIKRKSESDSAELRQSLEKAMSEASQLAFQAAVDAVGSAAQTVGDLKMAMGNDCTLSPGEKLTSPMRLPRSCSTLSRLPPGRKRRDWRRDAVQGDQDNRDGDRGHGADDALAKAGTGGSLYVDCDPASAGPSTGRSSGGASPVGLPRFGPKSGPFRPPTPSKKMLAERDERTSDAFFANFGPRGGTARPPTPTKPPACGGQCPEHVGDKGHTLL